MRIALAPCPKVSVDRGINARRRGNTPLAAGSPCSQRIRLRDECLRQRLIRVCGRRHHRRADPHPGVAVPGTNPRSVAVDPAGKFVYVANEGGNVSGYTINPTTGALAAIPGSPFPSAGGSNSEAVDPAGKFTYVANTFSNDVSAYTIDAVGGALTPHTGVALPRRNKSDVRGGGPDR
jgi:hypothetical protein